MVKGNLKVVLIRVAIMMVGLAIAHLGVTLFLLTDLGSDPFNVLIQGLFRTVSKVLPFLTHGRVHIAVSLLIMLVLLVVDKSYIKIGTILCMVFGGPIIDLFSLILTPLAIDEKGYLIRIPVLALGCVILAYGMTIVIKSEAGTGPNDLVAVVISDKSHKSFGLIRVLVDFSFVIIGFILGGTFGIGTIICAFLVGPVAGIFLPINERLIKKIVRD